MGPSVLGGHGEGRRGLVLGTTPVFSIPHEPGIRIGSSVSLAPASGWGVGGKGWLQIVHRWALGCGLFRRRAIDYHRVMVDLSTSIRPSLVVVAALGCWGQRDPAPATLAPTAQASPVVEPVAAVRARAGAMQVMVPSGSHTVLDPTLVWGDYNVYPAENEIVLQGAASGPIGDQSSAMFFLTGVHDFQSDTGPSHLEAVMIYEVECDDCPGDETTSLRIDSRRGTPERPAHLLGVESMRVADIDDDGSYEVIGEARFKPCCDDGPAAAEYVETITLTARGNQIVRLPDASK